MPPQSTPKKQKNKKKWLQISKCLGELDNLFELLIFPVKSHLQTFILSSHSFIYIHLYVFQNNIPVFCLCFAFYSGWLREKNIVVGGKNLKV